MAQIRARPRHLFSWGFDLYLDGELLTGFDMAWLREGGQFTWDGTEYQLSREGLWSGDFLLLTGDEVRARATKESAFERTFVVRLDERALRLEAASVFSRSFRLSEHGVMIGRVTPDHFFTRACTLDVPGDLPVPVQVFIFWLVVLMWRRADSAAAAS
jgi:hypothetical protein